jgi:hypothetical protein
VGLISRAQLSDCPHWKDAFSDKRKDSRYYELVEDTIRQGFNYGYFVIRGNYDKVDAIQPFFIIDQDLVAGVSPTIGAWINSIRGVWPRFLKMRTLMVGCAAGEGHLDGAEASLSTNAQLLAAEIVTQARNLRIPLIVLKEFPAKYREHLKCFVDAVSAEYRAFR